MAAPSPAMLTLLAGDSEHAVTAWLMWTLLVLLLLAFLLPMVLRVVVRRGNRRERSAMARDRERLREEIDAWRESARRMRLETDTGEGDADDLDDDLPPPPPNDRSGPPN